MFSEEDVRQIVDLGFTDAQAKAALVANNYNLNCAIEWILAGHHENQAGSSSGQRRPRRRRGGPSDYVPYYLSAANLGQRDEIYLSEWAFLPF